MQTDFTTAIRCDEAFNILNGSMEIYMDRDAEAQLTGGGPAERTATDEAVNQRALIADALAHETWVAGYLTVAQQDFVNDIIAQCRPLFRHRVGGRGARLELMTPNAAERLAERVHTEYRLEPIDYGDGRRHSGALQQQPLSFETFINVANEAIVDWAVRTQNGAFELRRCPQCEDYFIPRRAGRGRFCSDSCRAAYSQNETTFQCVFCARTLTHREYSGLILIEHREAPCDLWMEAYHRRVRFSDDDRVCIDCVMEHRPAWGRYVLSFADTPQRERTS